MNPQLYIDAALKILDPTRRELAPEPGSRGFASALVRGIDEKARTVTALVSTPNIDRYEELIDKNAYDKWLATFLSNPVLIANHVYSSPDGHPTVVGKWLDLKATDEGLIGTCQFMVDDELAEKWWNRFKQRMVRAFSVGFISHAYELREFEMESGEKRRLRVHTEAELLEISCVSIPANRQSLALAASAMSGRAAADPDAVSAGGKLSNRQFETAVRLVRPAIEKVLRDMSLDVMTSGPLYELINDIVDATVGRVLSGHVAHLSDGEFGELRDSMLSGPAGAKSAGGCGHDHDGDDDYLGDGDDLNTDDDDNHDESAEDEIGSALERILATPTKGRR